MGKYFRMEQKFGYLGISGLVRILAFFKVITWLIFLAEPGFGSKLMLDFQYVFQGEVFTLDKDDPVEGSVFIMGTKAAKKICDENSKFDVNIIIRNLKEEAKDSEEESGVSDGSGTD